MCGRYLITAPGNLIQTLFQLDAAPKLTPRYNAAPSQQLPVVRERDGARRCDMLQWGLVPFWAKDPSIANKLINARSETAAQKPSFREAMKRRRCLVVANGFYEWQPTGQGAMKQPWIFQLADEGPFAMAGLWESWQGPTSEGNAPLETFTILTTRANTLVAPVHRRMPVILTPERHAPWLNEAVSDADAVAAMLDAIDLGSPLAASAMKGRVVSRHVNRPANDDPRCLADPDETLFE